MLKEEGGGSEAFSKKRGYTEKEIAEYKEYTEIAMELDRRLGPDTAITREFDLQTAKEKVQKVKEKEVVDRLTETNNILDNIQLSDKDKPTRTISKIGQDAITYFSDGLHPLFVARKQFFKNGGTFDKIDPYKLARNYAGLESRILRFIEDSTLNGKTLAPNGKPLMEIVDPVINKVEVRENFTAFAVSKRGLEKINQIHFIVLVFCQFGHIFLNHVLKLLSFYHIFYLCFFFCLRQKLFYFQPQI